MQIEPQKFPRRETGELSYDIEYFRVRHGLPEDLARHIVTRETNRDKADALAELMK